MSDLNKALAARLTALLTRLATAVDDHSEEFNIGAAGMLCLAIEQEAKLACCDFLGSGSGPEDWKELFSCPAFLEEDATHIEEAIAACVGYMEHEDAI